MREALTGVLKALQPLALEIEEMSTIELVLAEALNNIVEHAYPDVTRGGPIRIRGDKRIDGLHFRIEDAGKAMPDGKTPIGDMPTIDVMASDLPEGGFGWFLIRDLTDSLSYRRFGAQNRLTLEFWLNRAVQP